MRAQRKGALTTSVVDITWVAIKVYSPSY